MAKLTLTDPSSLSNATSFLAQIAANNAATEAAMEKTLSRDGTVPNTMSADLDMNSHAILNLPEPTTNNEPVRFGDISSGADGLAVASQAEAEAGTSNVKLMTPLRTAQYVDNADLTPAIASQAEAEAGTDNTKMMTPLRTKDALNVTIEIASQAEAEEGTANTKLMTPLRTANWTDQMIQRGTIDATNKSLDLYAFINSADTQVLKAMPDGIGSAGTWMFGDPEDLDTTLTTTGGTTQEFRFPKMGYTNDDFGRFYSAYMEINEPGNPAQLGMTRFEGTLSSPTTLATNDMIGRIWFRPYLGSGSFWAQANTLGRTSEILSRWTDTGTNAGGTLEFLTAYPGDKGAHEVAAFYSGTQFVHFGRAGNSNVTGASNSLDVTTYTPIAAMTTMVPDIGTAKGFAILRNPQSGHDAADRGVVFSYVDSGLNSVPSFRGETKNGATYLTWLEVDRDTCDLMLGRGAFRVFSEVDIVNRWVARGGTSGNVAQFGVGGETNANGRIVADGTGHITIGNAGGRFLKITGSAASTVALESTDGDLTLASGAGGGKVISLDPFEANGIRTASVTVNDDSATSFTPAGTTGILSIQDGSSQAAMLFFRADGTTPVDLGTRTASINLASGILAGTTGTDAKITISTHTDGKIYIENRIGGARGFRYTVTSYQ